MNNFINKFSATLEKWLMPVADKLSNQKHLQAIKEGFIAIMPVTMVGSLIVLLKEVFLTTYSLFGEKLNTIEAYANNVQPFIDKFILPVANQIWWGTLALGVIFSIFTISYSLAGQYGVDKLSAAVVSTVAYLILLPQNAPDAAWGTISWTFFNSQAIFCGLIVAFGATEIFCRAVKKGWTFKMPDNVPPAVSKAFSAMIPAGIVFLIFGIISAIFLNGFDKSLQVFINELIQAPLVKLGQSPLVLIFLVLFQQILWFFGLHGALIVGPIFDTMYGPAFTQNMEAVTIYGMEPVNAVTRDLINIYSAHGGAGATLGLVIAMIIFAKRQDQKQLTKLALLPSVFQINEPVIYGLPIVLNPLMAIPFIFIPPLLVTIGWFFTEVVPFAGYSYIGSPWVTPPVINAFAGTGGNIGATTLSLITLLLSVLIYAPFVILANKQEQYVEYDESEVA